MITEVVLYRGINAIDAYALLQNTRDENKYEKNIVKDETVRSLWVRRRTRGIVVGLMVGSLQALTKPSNLVIMQSAHPQTTLSDALDRLKRVTTARFKKS